MALCFGSIEVTHAVLVTLSRRDIDLVWLTVDGKFRGRLSNYRKDAVTCRLAQYKRYLDPAGRLVVARARRSLTRLPIPCGCTE